MRLTIPGIPALFGYNYLTPRINDAISDMQVFVDEFVTKTAESYSFLGRGKGAEPAAHAIVAELIRKLTELSGRPSAEALRT